MKTTTTTTTTTKTSTTMLIALAVAGLAAVGAHARQGCTSDLNGDGIVNGADLTVLASEWGATFAPVASSVSPAAGPLEGGTEVTITGSHLAATTAVTIGGVEVPKIVSRSAESVVVITPPGGGGPTDVVVTTPFGAATLVGGFSYSLVPWATILEVAPDPAVVTNASLRAAIIATGLPWRVRDDASQIEMLLVPPGTFMMGGTADDPQLIPNEIPARIVSISTAFYIGRFEVTQAQWIGVMGWNDSVFGGFPDSVVRPVERVSWNNIQGFLSTTGLRLPSEAEWEYAARASSTEPRYGVLNDIAWWGSCFAQAGCNGNANAQTHPVGLLPANALGLHDTLGNVWEWVNDWYGPYASGPVTDPVGPSAGSERVLRGGGWYDPDYNCRVSRRDRRGPDTFMTHPNLSGLGFRAARSP